MIEPFNTVTLSKDIEINLQCTTVGRVVWEQNKSNVMRFLK